jgi:putative heme-binding domain-containing protein
MSQFRRSFYILIAVLTLGTLWTGRADGQAASQQRPGSRNAATAAQRRAAQQRAAQQRTANRPGGNKTATNRPGTRTAQGNRPTQRTTAQANQAPQKTEAEVKAEFQKLIGANWIWSPAHEKDAVPESECYFRKTITTGGEIELAEVHAACDNEYELFVNGQSAGRGADWRKMDVHDVTKLMKPGVNVVAIKAINVDAGAAGLVARVIVKERGGTYENFSSDESWRTSVKEAPNWKAPEFRDREWLAAKVYGPLGGVLPWGDEVVISNDGARFMIDPEFMIERMVTDEQAGSLIAMAFNAKGNILASQEGGPLLLISDNDQDGSFETVKPFCEELKNVQGILSLGAFVMAVGEGPDGGALYRLTDKDDDGTAEEVKALIKFRGLIGEHGPHAVQLGPEGLVYILCGNFAHADAPTNPQSPLTVAYEGDLVQPRYDDPNGYGAGVPAPGGTILRTDTEGSFVETVAGGMRNPYDFAFNADGELFTYDADMEWDVGTPWYRPTRVNHVPPGGELGWRSGWAKWPDHYLDSLPATIDVGAGSPTGVEAYNHLMFPKKFENALFVGDWALGKLHAVQLTRSGASYTAKLTTILKGRPLNVTDLAVGPDGALYFATGGRGTDGGVYRIKWKGNVPAETLNMGTGIQQALRQPQFQSDWSRRKIARVQKQLGNQWGPELERVINDPRAKRAERLRALDLMVFFGPAPTVDMLVTMSRDRDPEMRAKVARLMGTQADADFSKPLAAMLRDPDAWVRRLACEAIAHRVNDQVEDTVPVDDLVRLLADSDRFVAFAARKALEKTPVDQWQEKVLTATSARTFLQGGTGLLAAAPSREVALAILEGCEAMLRDNIDQIDGSPSAAQLAEFRDTLRVAQLALIRGELQPVDATSFADEVVAKYPTSDTLSNRELVKLLVYLQHPEAAAKIAAQIQQADLPEVEKLHLAAYGARLTAGWETDDKLAMLRYYEAIRSAEGGHSVSGYVENFARDFFTNLTLKERRQVLANGENFPTSSLSILAKIPADAPPEVWAEMRELDKRLEGREGESIARLRVGLTALLGMSGEAESLEYLREVYRNSPDRRSPIAMSLTQYPQGENWKILVDSLKSVDGIAVPEVLSSLRKVPLKPKEAEAYRNVILLGLKQTPSAGAPAVMLLEHWNGTQTAGLAELDLAGAADAKTPAEKLAVWQAWYSQKFPDELAAELPKESDGNKWSYDELLAFLDSAEGKAGNPQAGAQLFTTTAQCVKCHRFNGSGESAGPDLTSVSQRFQRREVLESIVYPSHVVSDQYQSYTVLANGRAYVGIITKHPDGSVTVLQSDGGKETLPADEIEEIELSKTSTMPDGLLNPLTLEQVADLFAFLMDGANGNMAGRGKTSR